MAVVPKHCWALDERARIAPERLDDAQHVFQALAATGSREGVKVLAEVRDAVAASR